MKRKNIQSGSTLVLALTIIAVGLILINVIADFALVNLRLGNSYARKATSREIAEAGINYYQWLLSHNYKDYCDGQACTANPPYGPYIHSYKNANGETIGQYTLSITPSSPSSPYVTVESIGKATNDPSQVTIEASIGIPSFSQYAWVVNDELYFAENSETYGKIHSNQGIRFDGTAHDLITSAKETYDYGCTSTEPKDGIWSQTTPTLGNLLGGYQFPVPPVNFNDITLSLQNIKTESQLQGQGLYLSPSQASGYQIIIKSDPNVLEVTKVTNANQNRIFLDSHTDTYPYPTNGIVFVEDNVYLSGTVNGKLTIAAATLPVPQHTKDNRSITIINDVMYKNNVYDGTIIFGAVAQQNVEIAKYIEPNLVLDGAYLAQYGAFGFDFTAYNNKLDLGTLITHGGLAADVAICQGYGTAAYNKDNEIMGFTTRTYYYDQNLFYNPPPMYPTTGTIKILSWRQK